MQHFFDGVTFAFIYLIYSLIGYRGKSEWIEQQTQTTPSLKRAPSTTFTSIVDEKGKVKISSRSYNISVTEKGMQTSPSFDNYC